MQGDVVMSEAVTNALDEKTRQVLDRQNRSIIGKDTLMVQVLGRDLLKLVWFAENYLVAIPEYESEITGEMRP